MTILNHLLLYLLFSALAVPLAPAADAAAADAAETDAAEAALADFVVGRYHLIGRYADGGAAYQGQVEIFRVQRSLRVRRTIDGRTIEGTAAIETAPLAETRVLRMRLVDAGRAYASTCLVQGDLDNYARLTCHRYRQDGGTGLPGLEALFHDPGPP